MGKQKVQTPPVDVITRGKSLASAMLTSTRGQDIEVAQMREFEGATEWQKFQILCAMGGSLMVLINEFRTTPQGRHHVNDFIRRIDQDITIAGLEAVIGDGNRS